MRPIWAIKGRTLRECIRAGFFVGAVLCLTAEMVTQFDTPRAIAAHLLTQR